MELEKQSHASYQKIAATLSAAVPPTILPQEVSTISEVNGNAGSGSRRNAWLGPLQSYAIRCDDESNSYANYLTGSVLPQLQQLITDQLKSRARRIRGNLSEAQSRLGKRHEVLLSSMAAHERAWETRVRLSVTPVQCGEGTIDETKLLSEAISSGDPFVSENELRGASKRFLEEKRVFCDVLMEQLTLTRMLEGDLAMALQTILVEALKVREQLLHKRVQVLSECGTITKDNESLGEWKEALKRNRLDWEWQVAAPPLDGFTASILTQINLNLSSHIESDEISENLVRRVSILKSGYLMKSGGTFGTKWSVLFCVLVDSAALHCYAPEQLYKLGHPDLRIPNSSLQIHRKGLLELNASASRTFLGEDPDNGDLLSQVTPSYSISLLHPLTNVGPDGKHADKHIFTIIIPGDGSLFGRSERQYRIRSFVEEDMVDWCIAIKEVVGRGVLLAAMEAKSVSSSALSTPRKMAPTDDIKRSGSSILEGDTLVSTRMITGSNTATIKSEMATAMMAMDPDRTVVEPDMTVMGLDVIVTTPTTPLAEEENPWDT